MKTVAVGARFAHEVTPWGGHTASAVGNRGVHSVSTPHTILYIEDVCHRALRDFLDPGEASVGVRVEVEHHAAAFLGATLHVEAVVSEVDRRRVRFEAEVHQGESLIMSGRHDRFVIDLARFTAGAARGPRCDDVIDFWFDFHSPWCHFASHRVGEIARRHGASVRWLPVHLANLSDAIGGRRPLEANPGFVSWYRQDMQDTAALHGLPFRQHPHWPLRPSRALRIAAYAQGAGKAEAFVTRVMRAYWAESRDISDPEVLSVLAAEAGLDPRAAEAAARDDQYRAALVRHQEQAIAAEVFGVPTAVVRGKRFFGNDRLDLLDHFLSYGRITPPHEHFGMALLPEAGDAAASSAGRKPGPRA